MAVRIFMAITILTVASLACGAGTPLPQASTPGPTTVDEISIPAPTAGDPRLTIKFGAGRLDLGPGAVQLVEGTASYNVQDLKPEVTTQGREVEIEQGDLFGLVEPRDVESAWDLRLGAMPMELNILAGAYEGSFELGGLALTGLTIKDGASSVKLAFSDPNPASMQVFRYETGASDVDMRGLANANFSTMVMTSGAGDYTLDFSGELRRDAAITITTGLSNFILVIPSGIPANVTTETGLSNVSAGSGWAHDGNRYTQAGTGPALTFIFKGGLGNLTLAD